MPRRRVRVPSNTVRPIKTGLCACLTNLGMAARRNLLWKVGIDLTLREYQEIEAVQKLNLCHGIWNDFCRTDRWCLSLGLNSGRHFDSKHPLAEARKLPERFSA
jgi:hypothetical protein